MTTANKTFVTANVTTGGLNPFDAILSIYNLQTLEKGCYAVNSKLTGSTYFYKIPPFTDVTTGTSYPAIIIPAYGQTYNSACKLSGMSSKDYIRNLAARGLLFYSHVLELWFNTLSITPEILGIDNEATVSDYNQYTGRAYVYLNADNIAGQHAQQQLNGAVGHPIVLDEAINTEPDAKDLIMPLAKKPTTRTVSEMFKVASLGGPLRHPDLVDSDVLLGIEVEVENFKGLSPEGWASKEDHSLRNSGREFTYGPATTGQLQNAIHLLCTMAPEQGWHANVRTGIHIHVNVSNMNLQFLQRFVECYLAAERTLFKYAGEWRRWCNFCHPLADSNEPLLMLRDLLSGKRGPNDLKNLGKYAGLNLVSLIQFGTVEVRILPTTFNYNQICAWVNAIIGIYETAKLMHEANMTYIEYKKAYGLDDIINNIFMRNKATALEFSEVISAGDFKRAHRYIRWLQAHATSDYCDPSAFDVSGWVSGKVKDFGVLHGEYLYERKEPYLLHELTKALQESYYAEKKPNIHFLARDKSKQTSSECLENLAKNIPNFGTALAAVITHNFKYL